MTLPHCWELSSNGLVFALRLGSKKMLEIVRKSFCSVLLPFGLKKVSGKHLEMILVKNWISQDPLETLFSERSSLGLSDML